MKPDCTDRQTQAGFTLIELLVAAGIAAVLALLAVEVAGHVAGLWSRGAGRISVAQQARAALDQITRDLSAAWFREDGNVWLAADVIDQPSAGLDGLWVSAPVRERPRDAAALTPSNLADARFGAAGVWLRFFTTSANPDENSYSSLPVAVSYRIVRRSMTAGGAEAAYRLHRFTVRPAAGESGINGTLEAGYTITAAAYAEGGSSRNGGTGGIHSPGGSGDYSAVLADHVIDFGARCYVFDSTTPAGLRPIFPNTEGGTVVALRSVRAARSGAADPTATGEFPEVMDVMVRVLTDEGVHLLSAFENGLTPVASDEAEAWWRIAVANSLVFVRRVTVRGGGG